MKNWLLNNQPELIGTLGVCLIIAGVAQWSRPAAFIFVGCSLFAFAYLTAGKTGKG